MTQAMCLNTGRQANRRLRGLSQAAVLPELQRVVTQQSLIDTRASLAGLAHLRQRVHEPAPSTVFMGVGLTSASELSSALPIDVLGMLFSAEHVREAVQADEITLLLADTHAVENGHDPMAVAERCATYERTLRRVLTRLRWPHVSMVRARELHALDSYARLHAQVRRTAPRDEHPYVTREVADIEYFARASGGIVKVGWALECKGSACTRDERSFDERFQRWIGSHVGFVYCKAGRTLDDGRKKAAPYVARDPARRVCLTREERVHEKLHRAQAQVSVSTLRGVRRHLKAIARSYKQLVRPVRGSVEDQVQQVLFDLLGPEVAA